MRVEFKFELDTWVKTPFGERGLITTLAYDESGIIYSVKTKNTRSWFKENQLEEQSE